MSMNNLPGRIYSWVFQRVRLMQSVHWGDSLLQNNTRPHGCVIMSAL